MKLVEDSGIAKSSFLILIGVKCLTFDGVLSGELSLGIPWRFDVLGSNCCVMSAHEVSGDQAGGLQKSVGEKCIFNF